MTPMLWRPPHGDRLRGLPPFGPVTPLLGQTLLAAAAKLRHAPADVAARLSELGVTVPGVVWPTERPTKDDVALFSRDLDGAPPWLTIDETGIPGWHLLRAAFTFNVELSVLVERILEFGLAPVGVHVAGDHATRRGAAEEPPA